MKPTAWRRGIEERLVRLAPDVHIEVLLLFGPCPEMDSLVMRREWCTGVRKYLRGRHGKAFEGCMNTCTNIIRDRIAAEVES